jgi:hypothetical protein
LKGLSVYEVLAHRHSVEGCSQVHQLLGGEHLLKRDVLHTEVRSYSLGPLHSLLKQSRWIGQLQLWDWRQDIWVLEEGLLGSLFGILVLDLGVDSGLWLVINPFSDEELVLIAVEVRALSLALVIDPMALEVVAISLGEYAIPISLALVPLALVDVTIGVDHSALALWHAIDPVSIVSITVLKEEGTSAVLLILKPVTSVLSPQLAVLVPPVGALAVLLVHSPHALIFVTVLVELDSETLLAIISPVADVPA